MRAERHPSRKPLLRRWLPLLLVVSLALSMCGVRWPSGPTAVATLAGSGTTGPLGGGMIDGPPYRAQFRTSVGLTIDAQGNLYVSERFNHRIRRISLDGVVSTVAGGGPSDPDGALVDGPALQARFSQPEGLCIDQAGNIYVADTLNDRIRRISPDGIVTTVAGSGSTNIYGSNQPVVDGPSDRATFNDPSDVEIDRAGVLYVADRGNHLIRRITPDGQVMTLAGIGRPGTDDGPGAQAAFEFPNRLAIDRAGNLYVTEGIFVHSLERTYGFRVRKITPDGRVTTLAGTGEPGYRDGPALEAAFDVVIGIAVDDRGNVYIAESGGQRIRVIRRNGVVETLAGNGVAGLVDGPAAAAEFYYPMDLALGLDGRLYVADSQNHRIRVITMP